MTLSFDKKLVSDARKVAAERGMSLNQLIVAYLEQMTQRQEIESDFCEFLALSGKGERQGWQFNRGELYERE